MENQRHFESEGPSSILEPQDQKGKYDHSLSYIDDPTVVFKQEKTNILLSCICDYKSPCKILDDPSNDVLPIYVPSDILGERKLDVKLIETLKKDFMDYGARVWSHGTEFVRRISGWAVDFSRFPDLSYERRVLGIKYTFWAFILDDILEDLVANGMLQSVAKPWLRNNIKIWGCKNEQLVDLRSLMTIENGQKIELAIKAQEILRDVIAGLQAEMPSDVFNLCREYNSTVWRLYETELERWVEILKSKAMASFEERVEVKYMASGLGMTYFLVLNSQDVEFHRIGSFFDSFTTMACCTENDIFSYFKESQNKSFPNVFNLVGIYLSQGMDIKCAFREVVKQRNDLFRAVELGLNNVPGNQRKSLSKVLLTLVAVTHGHFTNKRYGWIPVLNREA